MKARILFLSDLHKRDCDFSTIAGYTKAVDTVQQDILNFVRTNKVTHIISMGDWYDKGYRSINRLNHDRNLDEELSEAVNGNFYICLGNHFFLERDNNPEMYLIQPNPFFKPSKPIYANRPVIRAVPSLRIGSLQISFFHFSKKNKEYVQERDPDATFHIGVYHDESVIPTAYRSKIEMPGTTSTSRLDTVFANIDLAIVGHIHTPVGAFKFPTSKGDVPMVVPGSLAITASGARNMHTDVNLPMIDLTDEGKLKMQLVNFSVHAELLRFYSKKDKPLKGDVRSIEDKPIDIPDTLSLPEYLRAHGYDENSIKLVDAASEAGVAIKQGLVLLGLAGGKSNGA